MTSALARNLLMPARPAPRVPQIAIVFPLEGKVEVEVDCAPSEQARLFDAVLADERRADLIGRAFQLAEGGEA